ncbi:ABC-2 transporter permease [Paenibacillus sepulcri]|uniref:ABC-2 transporter permease n=1 Tax=Paenibacillus sepulcri TaxID=359917 RepID=A0ABS7C6Z6_9BACL|nr:ABC-2 transporter permease [Paenibacillus sepulcri]
MVQLLVKDLRIQKPFLILGFIFIGIFFFALGAFEGLPLSVPAAIFSHFLIVVSSKMDERNHNGRMLASFPLRRFDIVTSKYAGVFMFMAFAFLLTCFWRIAASLLLPEGELPWFSLQSTILTIAALLIFYSIYFPLFFAFGSRIVQTLDLIVLFTVGGLVLITLRVLEWSGINLGSRISGLLTGNTLASMIWLAAGCMALLLLSWLVSLFIYNRRNI